MSVLLLIRRAPDRDAWDAALAVLVWLVAMAFWVVLLVLDFELRPLFKLAVRVLLVPGAILIAAVLASCVCFSPDLPATTFSFEFVAIGSDLVGLIGFDTLVVAGLLVVCFGVIAPTNDLINLPAVDFNRAVPCNCLSSETLLPDFLGVTPDVLLSTFFFASLDPIAFMISSSPRIGSIYYFAELHTLTTYNILSFLRIAR